MSSQTFTTKNSDLYGPKAAQIPPSELDEGPSKSPCCASKPAGCCTSEVPTSDEPCCVPAAEGPCCA